MAKLQVFCCNHDAHATLAEHMLDLVFAPEHGSGNNVVGCGIVQCGNILSWRYLSGTKVRRLQLNASCAPCAPVVRSRSLRGDDYPHAIMVHWLALTRHFSKEKAVLPFCRIPSRKTRLHRGSAVDFAVRPSATRTPITDSQAGLAPRETPATSPFSLLARAPFLADATGTLAGGISPVVYEVIGELLRTRRGPAMAKV